MFRFEHLHGLPYAVFGDTVEVVVSNSLISLTHYGADESKRMSKVHKGQYHPWRLLLDAKDIKSVHVKTLPKPGGLLGGLFGSRSKDKSAPTSAYLTIEAQIGESRITAVLKGDSQASQHLKERMLSAQLQFGSGALNTSNSW